LAEQYGDKWRDAPESDWLAEIRAFTIDAMMDLVREDLAALGVRHDVFTSERRLVEAGKVDAALRSFEARGLIYTGVLEPPKGKKPDDWEPREQTLFRATAFGDEVDRPLKKSDGSWTYFASDIAYHGDKVARGFNTLIDVWGADHGGYVKRMNAATDAISEGAASLDVKICQIVKLLDGGTPVKMSKRAGTFVTLRELIDEVGSGVVRFIMLTRSNDAPLDFDLTKVTEQSRDNPVFYVQYAHARCHSVARMAVEAFPSLANGDGDAADLDLLADEAELALIKILAQWPRVIEGAADAHEPHRIAYYLHDLASAFHGLWTKGKEQTDLRFIVENDISHTVARLALVRGVRSVIASGLELMGVTPLEELR
jgi:arginyl-tRNA synthetase